MSEQRCVLVTIAEGDYCGLARCRECGGLHLSVGSVSMRLPGNVVMDLKKCLDSALGSARSCDGERPKSAESEGLRAPHLKH